MYSQVITFVIACCISFSAIAHEMVPAYPKLEPFYMNGVYKTDLKLFNKRKDVAWYEVGVFDSNWNSLPFVSKYKIMHLPYLQHVSFTVYIRSADKSKATYICSTSKLRPDQEKGTLVSSKICSKFK